LQPGTSQGGGFRGFGGCLGATHAECRPWWWRCPGLMVRGRAGSRPVGEVCVSQSTVEA
jgi:hypothetical protein